MRQFIADLKARHPPLAHPYVVALQEGEMSRGGFIETQIQLYYAARAFAGPVLTLAARLGEPGAWQSLVDGLLQPDPHEAALRGPAALHELLIRLGVPNSAIGRRNIWPGVRAFNAALRGLCANADPQLGLAALGMIEDIFGGVGSALGEGIVARGWLTPEALVHYPAEPTLNAARAEAFLARLDWPHGRDPAARAVIRDGLETGDHLARRLLDDLFVGREQVGVTRDRTRTADIARRVREMAALEADPGQ